MKRRRYDAGFTESSSGLVLPNRLVSQDPLIDPVEQSQPQARLAGQTQETQSSPPPKNDVYSEIPTPRESFEEFADRRMNEVPLWDEEVVDGVNKVPTPDTQVPSSEGEPRLAGTLRARLLSSLPGGWGDRIAPYVNNPVAEFALDLAPETIGLLGMGQSPLAALTGGLGTSVGLGLGRAAGQKFLGNMPILQKGADWYNKTFLDQTIGDMKRRAAQNPDLKVQGVAVGDLANMAEAVRLTGKDIGGMIGGAAGWAAGGVAGTALVNTLFGEKGNPQQTQAPQQSMTPVNQPPAGASQAVPVSIPQLNEEQVSKARKRAEEQAALQAYQAYALGQYNQLTQGGQY